MKRSLVIGVVLSLASAASAAQVNFFFTSTDATNGVIDATTALTLGLNPEVTPGGVRQLSLWMAIDPALTANGTMTFNGAGLDVAELGGQSGNQNLVVFAPGRYGVAAQPGVATSGGYTHQGLRFIPAGPNFLPQNPNDGVIGGYNVFLVASGSINANDPGELFLEVPLSEVVGISTGTAGIAFGFRPAGGFGPADPWDITGVYDNGGGFVDPVAQLGANGFDSDTLNYFSSIRTTIADLVVTPEPASVSLLLLGLGALARRRAR